MKAKNTSTLLKNFLRFTGLVIFGANKGETRPKAPKWSLRVENDDVPLPKFEFAIADASVTRSNRYEEDKLGCAVFGRAIGKPAKLDLSRLSKMLPCRFNPRISRFEITPPNGQTFTTDKVPYMILKRDGTAFAEVSLPATNTQPRVWC